MVVVGQLTPHDYHGHRTDRPAVYELHSMGMLLDMTIRIACIIHSPSVGAGTTSAWAQDRGHSWHEFPVASDGLFPEPATTDLLIVAGGPMGAYEIDEHPWLLEELRFLRTAISDRIPAIGLCLGAQLLATALGGSVDRHSHFELGWWPVQLLPASERLPELAHLGRQIEPVMWHGDTFHLAPSSTLLATSAGCERQAFSDCEGRVLGLQFHPEFDTDDLERLMQTGRYPDPAGRWVQAPDQVTSRRDLAERMRIDWWKLLDEFTRQHVDVSARDSATG